MSSTFRFTDLGNARRLVHQYKESIRYCVSWKKWLIWDGKRWAIDSTKAIERYAKEAIYDLYAEASKENNDSYREALVKHAQRSESQNSLRNMVNLAESEKEVAVVPEVFDADRWVLNCQNGKLDLRTGKLLSHCPSDLISKIAPVNFDLQAGCPTWINFLDRIMDGSPTLLSYLQRIFGYALTGITNEQAMFLFYGEGANGKTTLLETISTMLGDYGVRAAAETLLVKKGNGISNDIARLVGKRFVLASESEEGRKLASAQIKVMTGGDGMTARFLYGEFFEFIPQFKIFLATNHVPIITDTTNSIWRRIHLVPFAVKIPEDERDKELGEKLRKELPGILNWALQGCLEWQKEGLKAPQEVQKATLSYRKEMDVLEAFLQAECVLNLNGRVGAGELSQRFRDWAATNGEHGFNAREFKQRMTEKGFTSSRSGINGSYEWHGIGLI